MPPFRTVLYVPAHSQVLFDAGVAAQPDTVIVDLEDAVPGDEKEIARLGLGRLVRALRSAGIVAVVRINGVDIPSWRADLDAVGDARPDAVLVPKADAAGVETVRGALADGAVGCWALVERVHDLLAVDVIARCDAVEALVLGYGDLCKDLGLPLATSHPELAGARRLVTGAALEHELLALDGVHLGPVDDVEMTTTVSIAAGFGGRTLYDARHVAPCRAAWLATGSGSAAPMPA